MLFLFIHKHLLFLLIFFLGARPAQPMGLGWAGPSRPSLVTGPSQ